VIQIGQNREVLYVNYGLDPAQGLRRFHRKHPRLTGSCLRPDLYGQEREYRFGKQAKRAAQELIRELEGNGYEVIAGGPLMNDFWQTYVIEIRG
jgi:hypothetical protein